MCRLDRNHCKNLMMIKSYTRQIILIDHRLGLTKHNNMVTLQTCLSHRLIDLLFCGLIFYVDLFYLTSYVICLCEYTQIARSHYIIKKCNSKLNRVPTDGCSTKNPFIRARATFSKYTISQYSPISLKSVELISTKISAIGITNFAAS